MMTIMIVDDHPLVREGMASMLENESDFKVTASVASGVEAVAWCKENGAPDVVVSDIRMPGMDGFETLAKLQRTHPDIRMLMLAGMPLKAEEEKARAAKARGYLPKSIDWERLVAAIRLAAKKGEFIAESFDEVKAGPLSPRETEIVRYISQGKTHEEIGIILGISSETVRSHTKSIQRKLDCTNSASAVTRAFELGILRA